MAAEASNFQFVIDETTGAIIGIKAGGATVTFAEVAMALTNPMTAAGDLIVGGSSGTPDVLAKGTNGKALKMVAGAPAWAADTPMTAAGDLIIGGASGVATRLPKDTDGMVLTLVSGLPTWV